MQLMFSLLSVLLCLLVFYSLVPWILKTSMSKALLTINNLSDYISSEKYLSTFSQVILCVKSTKFQKEVMYFLLKLTF